MTTNRSAEELAMRAAVEAWGRARWPKARVVHELVILENRIDMAFIEPGHIVGVEIKSSKDVLDRLDKQIATFRAHLPEVWFAIAPKWKEHEGLRYRGDTIIVADGAVTLDRGGWRTPVDRAVTVQMLWMLWRDELLAIATRKRLEHTRRSTVRQLVETCARLLTGDEIVAEVCRELRGRAAFWKADAPILETRPQVADVVAPQARLGL